MLTVKPNNRFEKDSIKERALTIRRVIIDLKLGGNGIEITAETKGAVESLCTNLDYTAINQIAQNETQRDAIIYAINA